MYEAIPAELRSVLRLALKSSETISAALDVADKTPEIPVRKDLLDAILFSRSFLPTYLAVVAIVILLWALKKWTNIVLFHRARQSRLRQSNSATSPSSSSSSTLQGTESPPFKSDDVVENTPLLADARLRTHERGRSVVTRTWLYMRSILLYQPRPIPALTAPKNTLPPNETSIAVILFLSLNVFYMFYNLTLSRDLLFAVADRAGLLFVVNLPLLYLLAAKNNQPLKWLTGWSYEGLNLFHRRLGEWMTVAAVLHATGMLVIFYDLIAPFGFSLGWYLTRRIVILGLLAFSAYLTIYFTSVGYFRQLAYELFLVVHIFAQVAALAFLFFHHHSARPYVAVALGIWVLDRGVSRIVLKTKTFIATLEIAADKETVLLHCDIPIQKRALLSSGITNGWHAGQHVFLTIPGMGTKYQFQAHPFTIASPAPLRDTDIRSWPLQLTIRAQDGFSKELLDYAQFHQHTKVLLEGPYSSDEVLHAMRNSERVCLIAGGSGIAVTYPFAWAQEAKALNFEAILHDRNMYMNGQRRVPMVQKSNKDIDQTQFGHFWVRQESAHESWITMAPRSSNAAFRSPPSDLPTVVETGLDLVTHRFDTRSSSTGNKERPDMRAELRAWVHGDHKHEIDKRHSICVVVSGPDGLVRDIQNEVSCLVRDAWQIDVHVEKFGW